jgi:hypothetical protein
MREKNICPMCGKEADPIEIIMNEATAFLCECGFEWDINEDFNCIFCNKELGGRYLFCSLECADKLI